MTLAVLLAALLHAAWNAMLRGGQDVLLDTASIVVGAGIVMLPLTVLVPLPAPMLWPYLIGSLLTHVAYYYLIVGAYRHGELSLVYPLMRGVAPLLAAVFGIVLLRETPTAPGAAGMLLISAGVVALALRPRDAERESGRKHRRAIGFALGNAAVIAVYTIIDGAGARQAASVGSYVVWLFVLDGLMFAAFMLATRGKPFVQAMQQRWRGGLIGGGFSAAAYGISLWAMTKAPIALVASLRETSVVFATLIGARLLQEKLTRRRWAGIGAVMVGVMAFRIA